MGREKGEPGSNCSDNQYQFVRLRLSTFHVGQGLSSGFAVGFISASKTNRSSITTNDSHTASDIYSLKLILPPNRRKFRAFGSR